MTENRTLNQDGSLKDPNWIAWEYSRTHKDLQLPGERRTGGGTSAAGETIRSPDLGTPTSVTLSEGVLASAVLSLSSSLNAYGWISIYQV